MAPPLLDFETHPDRYRHWRLEVGGDGLARLTLAVDPDQGFRPGYELKLNSYDLGVDRELADAVDRLRFEHPEVRAVVVASALDRVFSAGANIPMLAAADHAFKVNFCKVTNETRLAMEDASRRGGPRFVAALKGTCAGGGYELALACDRIVLVDDGSSAVSLPEVPMLAVLPGTGGLTRLVDKRRVRRDRADVFCTTAEGIRGRRALDWGLVDALAPRSRFDEEVEAVARRLAAENPGDPGRGPGIVLNRLDPTIDQEGRRRRYRHVELAVDASRRVAELTVRGPTQPPPGDVAGLQAAGADLWSLRAFRELDDALLHLRFGHPEVGVVLLRTRGAPERVLAADGVLRSHGSHWLADEILALQARVLRRLDLTARSFFAVIDGGSCFAGSLFELALAADRTYMREGPAGDGDEDAPPVIALGPGNQDAWPTSTGWSRLQARFAGAPEALAAVRELRAPLTAAEAVEAGLVTDAVDELDWEDDLRIAVEERLSLSPDALTGMEASLRFPGPETMESKIFARLTAWQNWVFQRPNATGPAGALTRFGTAERPRFDWTRC